MAYRTLYFSIEDGEEDSTASSGDKIDFTVSSGTNSAFGNHIPTYFEADFNSSSSSGMYANYSGSVKIEWEFRFKINGTWYYVDNFSRTMSKSNSNWYMSGSISSSIANLLKSYPIEKVAIYQSGDRGIKATSSATGSMTIEYTEVYPYLNAPGSPTIKDNGNGTFNASWSAASYGNGSGSPTYELWSRNSGSCVASAGSSTSVSNLPIPSYGSQIEYYVVAYYSGLTYAGDGTKVTFQVPYPTITSQPTLSLGSTSGASVSISWTEAEVANQNGATIKYQYFVGPSSTYSDDYRIGETTGLSVALTEENIISKCGAGFGASTSGSICYIFVRAYWEKNDEQGGWVEPQGKEFTYYPTVNAPTNLALSHSSGIETKISWTNNIAGNGSMPQVVLFIDSQEVASGVTDYSQGMLLPKEEWRAHYNSGTYEIKVAHEWYGRYAYSSPVTFKYESGLVTYFDGTTPRRCEVYVWDDSKKEFVLCMPYYNDNGSWKVCGY